MAFNSQFTSARMAPGSGCELEGPRPHPLAERRIRAPAAGCWTEHPLNTRTGTRTHTRCCMHVPSMEPDTSHARMQTSFCGCLSTSARDGHHRHGASYSIRHVALHSGIQTRPSDLTTPLVRAYGLQSLLPVIALKGWAWAGVETLKSDTNP